MSKTTRAIRWVGIGAAAAAGTYAGVAAATWFRYGRPAAPTADEADPFLDQFMPSYDVVERHHVRVAAPADVTFAAACDIDMLQSPFIRAIFKTRQLVMGGTEDDDSGRPRGVVPFMKATGWTVLADTPGRELVFGSVTQPWMANPKFRPIPAETFSAFVEPDCVKIVLSVRADAIGPGVSEFRSETRAVGTDRAARTKFRRYWSLVAPGVVLIRRLMMTPVKTEAERRIAAA